MCLRPDSGESLLHWSIHEVRDRIGTDVAAVQATLQGREAVDALLSATPDTPSYMIGISENKITRVPLVEAVLAVSLSSISQLFLTSTADVTT